MNRPAHGKAASEDRLPPNKAYFLFLFLSLVYPTGSRQPGPGQGREGLHQSAIGLASQSLVQRPAASHRAPVRNADSWGPDGWVRTCISAGSLADACAQGGSRAADPESSIGRESWRDRVPRGLPGSRHHRWLGARSLAGVTFLTGVSWILQRQKWPVAGAFILLSSGAFSSNGPFRL